jgi:hypothetical protein
MKYEIKIRKINLRFAFGQCGVDVREQNKTGIR